MGKTMWTNPVAVVEQFVSNEYISACYDYTVSLSCAIPGRYSSHVHDGTEARNNHGICANTATFDVSGSRGFEVTDGSVNHLRPISNIVLGTKIDANTTTGFSTNIGDRAVQLENGCYYRATWTSTDLENNTGNYNHYGLAYVTGAYADPNRPNHS